VAVVIRRALLGSNRVEIRVEGDRIAEVAARVRTVPGDTMVDARGGSVIPGLHDHHLHIRAAAAARRSLPVGPDSVRDAAGFATALQAAARTRPPGHWVRAVGYHESVTGELDRRSLDAIVADRPVRVQHRSGSLWSLNSAGLAVIGADQLDHAGVERDEHGRATGRLWRMDAYLANLLGSSTGFSPVRSSDLGMLSSEALALGVTGWTDATPGRGDDEAMSLAAAVDDGEIGQRLHLMQPVETQGQTIRQLEGHAGVTVGPVKVLLSDADLPSLADLVGWVEQAHASGRAVAVHCVTRVQIVLTLAAFDEAGPVPGDRIEHGAIVPEGLLRPLAASGITIVTQPNFVAERGDQYLADVGPDDLVDLWRGRTLREAGVTVAAGTDAPFGSLDPWVAVRAAIERVTATGAMLGPGESVRREESLRWWWGSGTRPGRPRTLEPGQPGDLCVLAVPVAEALADGGPVPVTATLVAGQLRFSSS
jgi:predicted amidohydrolase YtcJ